MTVSSKIEFFYGFYICSQWAFIHALLSRVPFALAGLSCFCQHCQKGVMRKSARICAPGDNRRGLHEELAVDFDVDVSCEGERAGVPRRVPVWQGRLTAWRVLDVSQVRACCVEACRHSAV